MENAWRRLWRRPGEGYGEALEKAWRRLWRRFGEGYGAALLHYFSVKERLPQDVRTSRVSRRDREGRAKGFKDFQGLQEREREGERERGKERQNRSDYQGLSNSFLGFPGEVVRGERGVSRMLEKRWRRLGEGYGEGLEKVMEKRWKRLEEDYGEGVGLAEHFH